MSTATNAMRRESLIVNGRYMRCPRCRKENDILMYIPMGVVDEFRSETVPIYKCPECFVPGTMVRTRQGWRPIETIGVGDLVLTQSGTFQRVTDVHCAQIDEEITYISVPLAYAPIGVTKNHPLLVVESPHDGECRPWKCKQEEHELQWVHAGHLKVGDYWATATLRETEDSSHAEVPLHCRGRYHSRNAVVRKRKGPDRLALTDEFLWALGLYLAEGCTGKRELTYALHAEETVYHDRLSTLYGDEYGLTTRLDIDGNKGNVSVSSAKFADWFTEWLGRGCENKAIPAEIMNLPNHKLRHVVQGINDGDGCEQVDVLAQTSRELALQVCESGLRMSEDRFKPSTNFYQKANRKDVYTVYNANGTGYEPGKSTRAPLKYSRNTWKNGDNTLYRVTDVRSERYVGKVYNFEVENDPTYVIEGGLVAHNCRWLLAPSNNAIAEIFSEAESA